MTDPLGLIPNASRPIQPIRPIETPSSSQGPSFKDVLLKHIEQVNRLQQDAQAAIEDLAAGRRDDVAAVMLAKQKADLAFQMLLQIRNKMVAAYEEIKQIRV